MRPRRTAWALKVMRPASAWRNTVSRRATGTRPEAMRSLSTMPGPTEGSWSTSPTSTSRAWSGRAASSAAMSSVSIMEDSSTITSSASTGRSALRPKPLGPASSRRWMVEAGRPVASERRLAALPVGAARATAGISPATRPRMKRMMVVLPVPGPPVMTSTLWARAGSTAARCSAPR